MDGRGRGRVPANEFPDKIEDSTQVFSSLNVDKTTLRTVKRLKIANLDLI
jgi:hypothetical protein